MKSILQAVGDSIGSEVSEAADWTIQLNDPPFRDWESGKNLYIYGNFEMAGTSAPNAGGDGFRVLGYYEDIYEFVMEYVEPSDTEVLTRDEEAELDNYDVAKLLRKWGDGHQVLPTPDDPENVHRLDWQRTDYQPALRRERMVRYCQLTFQARRVNAYT